MEAWLAAQATGITIRGLLLDRPYTLNLLTELQGEHAAADNLIRDGVACPGGSPRFAAWLEAQTTHAGIPGLPQTPRDAYRSLRTPSPRSSTPTVTRCQLAPGGSSTRGCRWRAPRI